MGGRCPCRERARPEDRWIEDGFERDIVRARDLEQEDIRHKQSDGRSTGENAPRCCFRTLRTMKNRAAQLAGDDRRRPGCVRLQLTRASDARRRDEPRTGGEAGARTDERAKRDRRQREPQQPASREYLRGACPPVVSVSRQKQVSRRCASIKDWQGTRNTNCNVRSPTLGRSNQTKPRKVWKTISFPSACVTKLYLVTRGWTRRRLHVP